MKAKAKAMSPTWVTTGEWEIHLKFEKIRMLPRIAHGRLQSGVYQIDPRTMLPTRVSDTVCELLSPALTRREHIVSSKYDTFLNNIYTRSISTRATIWQE